MPGGGYDSGRPDSEIDKRKGACVMCRGDLQEKMIVVEAARGLTAVMPREPYVEVADGYFCTDCGIRYEFIPNLRAGLL